jgi:hypothetical protein
VVVFGSQKGPANKNIPGTLPYSIINIQNAVNKETKHNLD